MDDKKIKVNYADYLDYAKNLFTIDKTSDPVLINFTPDDQMKVGTHTIMLIVRLKHYDAELI